MVRGRFCVKRCGPSRHCLRDASAVLENFARHPKKTLSTLSAHFGSFARVPRRPLMMRERSSRAPHFITFDTGISRAGADALSTAKKAASGFVQVTGLAAA